MKLSADVLALNADVLQGQTSGRLKTGLGVFRSKLEKRAAETWAPGFFDWWLYEPFTLKFPGGAYTPDLFGPQHNPMADDNLVSLCAVEVKGWNANLRADRLKFRVAAETHLWLKFCWLTWKDGRWHEDWYVPR